MPDSNAQNSQNDTANHRNETPHGGSVGNVPPRITSNPSSPSESNNPEQNSGAFPWLKKHLDIFRFGAEIAILVITLKIACIYSSQLDQMIETNRLAQKTFNASQRPYVGVNGVGVSFRNDQSAVTQRPDNKTQGMTYSIEIRNFGPVPGSNYRGGQRAWFGGVEQPISKVPDKPTTIFPSENLYLPGDISGPDYKLLASGSKTLVIEVAVEYDGPEGNYKYCSKRQYQPNYGAFMDLGSCTHQ